MKVGIITFHWATNYGAVLQTYALQEYLKTKGYDVEIINYKPRHYDFFFKYLYNPALIRFLKKDLISKFKEQKIDEFRKSFLNLTSRFFSISELCNTNLDYDIVISGSDQVLNPYFTINGEGRPTDTYYIPFCIGATKIGYAISFGCTDYPNNALRFAKQWINNFDRIGVRESSGLNILSQMGFTKYSEIVPDPTILRGRQLIIDIIGSSTYKKNYICVYMLRLSITINEDNVVYIDDTHNPLSITEWVNTINAAKFMITNSYHGMIVAILSHTPFAVLLETSSKYKGMNDRFITLLSRLGLESHIISTIDELNDVINLTDNWDKIDKQLENLQLIGTKFLGL